MTDYSSQRLPPIDDIVARRSARDTDALAGAIEPASVVERAADIDSRDWDCLFTAVTDRLRSAVAERLAENRAAPLQDARALVAATVIECSDALDQLYASRGHERARRKKLERELLNAQTALSQLRAELVGAQASETLARRVALHDDLTALPNRNFFRWRLDDALGQPTTEQKKLAVLYLDLDSFKPINDVHGHHAGDELLRIIAERLARSMRSEDMVSRVGGDEFACLLAGAPSREKLSRLAGDLLDVVSEPLHIGDTNVTVRPSIGIAMAPSDGTTAEALLKNADAAMYMAKRRRSGYVFFSDCGTTSFG